MATPTPEAGTAEPPEHADFLALFTAVMLPMFMAAVDQTLLATATPRIAADLGGLAQTSWVAIGYLLAVTITVPLYGRLGDRFGRRNVLMGALGVFMAGSLACALAINLPMLIAARVLQGLGGGGLMVLSQALIGELVPPRQRPRYQGYFAIVFAASSVGGPVIGGFVVNHGDWRWLFWANLPLGLLAAWRIASLPRPGPSAHRNAPHDPLGVVLFALSASAALLWFSLVGNRFALASAPSLMFAGAAVLGFALLWGQQRAHAHPFLPLDVARQPGVGWICLTVLAFAGSLFGLIFLLPIYLQLSGQGNAATSGLQLLALTLGLVIGSTINGRISVRIGESGRFAPWGLGAAALALLSLAALPPTRLGITMAAAVCGLGFGTVMQSAQIATQLAAGRDRLGAAAALISLTRSAGASLGTAAFGGLAFALLQAPGALPGGNGLRIDGIDPARVDHAFRIVFGALAALCALGSLSARRAPIISLGSDPKPLVEQ